MTPSKYTPSHRGERHPDDHPAALTQRQLEHFMGAWRPVGRHTTAEKPQMEAAE